MPLEAKCFRHAAVAIPQVRVSHGIPYSMLERLLTALIDDYLNEVNTQQPLRRALAGGLATSAQRKRCCMYCGQGSCPDECNRT
jgi:hypothetical protein